MSSRAGLLAAALALAGCEPSSPPPGIERWIAAFNDPSRPYPERVAALKKLGALREQDDDAVRGIYPRLQETLTTELSRWNGMAVSDLEEEAVIEALAWHADAGDAGARIQMELHLDRATVEKKRLAVEILIAIALNLAKYPRSPSSGRTLWAVLGDAGEKPVVRAAALKSLKAFHPDDLTERLLDLKAGADDPWLRDLQDDLR